MTINAKEDTIVSKVGSYKTRIEISCRSAKALLVYFEKKYGREELKKFVNKTGMPLEYLENENNWLLFSYYTSLFDEFVNYVGNPNLLFEAGTYVARPDVYGSLYFVFRVVADPSLSYKNIVKFAHTFSKASEAALMELKKNKAVINVHYLNGFIQTVNNCRFVQGNYASIPTVWGLPLAKVNHPKCQAKGDDSCVYEITWVNKPSRLFGYYGLLGGAVAGWLFYIFNEISRFFSLTEELIIIFVLLLCGYLLGRSKDYMNIVKESRELYEGQNEALSNSIKEIEEFNVGLQKKVEERTEELSVANKKLEGAYKDLKENETRLVQSEKLASLGRLIAGIAHEVNTPAGAIRSSSSYLLSHSKDFIFDILNIEELNLEQADRVLYSDIIRKIIENTLKQNGFNLKEEKNSLEAIKQKVKELNLELPYGAEKILAECRLTDDLINLSPLLVKYDPAKLLKGIQDVQRCFVNLKSIDIGTSRIAELVKALKVYSHLDQSKVEEVDVREGIETSLMILKNELKEVEVVKNFSNIPKVTCYVNELNQVWTNLILNACEAIKGKGRISIETYEKEGKAAVKISDDGPEIPPDVISRMFEPFFTTKAKGTGMGLSICQQIIEKHNGEINVKSEPGRTSFEVILPVIFRAAESLQIG